MVGHAVPRLAREGVLRLKERLNDLPAGSGKSSAQSIKAAREEAELRVCVTRREESSITHMTGECLVASLLSGPSSGLGPPIVLGHATGHPAGEAAPLPVHAQHPPAPRSKSGSTSGPICCCGSAKGSQRLPGPRAPRVMSRERDEGLVAHLPPDVGFLDVQYRLTEVRLSHGPERRDSRNPKGQYKGHHEILMSGMSN